ncbi:hypothetical protein Ancab_020612 [Ancistrocladus abbreviatus]
MLKQKNAELEHERSTLGAAPGLLELEWRASAISWLADRKWEPLDMAKRWNPQLIMKMDDHDQTIGNGGFSSMRQRMRFITNAVGSRITTNQPLNDEAEDGVMWQSQMPTFCSPLITVMMHDGSDHIAGNELLRQWHG